jgi:hypothetical protein
LEAGEQTTSNPSRQARIFTDINRRNAKRHLHLKKELLRSVSDFRTRHQRKNLTDQAED